MNVGWKVNGLIVEGSLDPARLPGQPQDTGETVDLDTVHRRPCDYGITELDGWTFIADPALRAAFNDEAALALTSTGRTLAWVTNSVATLHGFAWYVDGKPVRRIMYAEGVPVDEFGDSLSEEVAAPAPLGEDYVFEMMQRLTGRAWGDAADAPYHVWTCTA
ncbi:hypothetical protein GCM10009764_44260 [Nocardia ninae]